jgi:hypothetical protein
LEGSMSGGEFVQQHAQRPNIDLLVVFRALHNLRRDIVNSSTKGAPLAE